MYRMREQIEVETVDSVLASVQVGGHQCDELQIFVGLEVVV